MATVSLSKPLIINFTPTGLIPTKSMTPHVPISPAEIIEQTHQVYELGITVVHLHARNPDETPTLECRIYEEILLGINKFCPGLVTCLSLSGRAISDWRKRLDPISLRADMGSLTLSSLNFSQQASLNSPSIISQLLERMNECGVTPELEVFDTGMINYANYLVKKGLLLPPLYFNIILGGVATAQFHPVLVDYMNNQLPQGSLVSLGGIGDYQGAVLEYAVKNGFGVRVGLEDNIYLDKGRQKMATNLQLVNMVHSFAHQYNRRVMPSIEFRNFLKSGV